MQTYLLWAIAGIVLIIAELISGTYHLLVIGIAAFAGAGAAYLGYAFWVQAVLAAAVAVAGVIATNRFRGKHGGASSTGSLDIGQSVVLDEWTNEADRIARVRYRNALWDAKVIDAADAHAGEVFYICGSDGSTLHVSKARPA